MNLNKLILFVFMFSVFYSCKKKEDDDCPVCPVVSSISPTHGHRGDTVIINGSNFSSSPTSNFIKFNGTAVSTSDIISGNTSQLVVLVPSKCGTGPVTVDVDADLTSAPGPVFTYEVTATLSVYAGTPGVSGDSPDGTPFVNALFNHPSKISVDKDLNLYFIDEGNTKVRKLNFSDGLEITLSDITEISDPAAIAVDENNTLYVSGFNGTTSSIFKFTSGSTLPINYFHDTDNNRRHVSIAYVGPGEFYIARLKTGISVYLYDMIHLSTSGMDLFLQDAGDEIFYRNSNIYQLSTFSSMSGSDTKLSKFSTADTSETILADYGTGLNNSQGLVVTSTGDIYISDSNNSKIVKYSATSGLSDILSSLNSPRGMAIDKFGNIYFAEYGDHCIRKITFE